MILCACRIIAFVCLTSPVYAQNTSATLLTEENQQKIELAVWKYAVDTPLLLKTVAWAISLRPRLRVAPFIPKLQG